jgi:signal transduction histidine kinase
VTSTTRTDRTGWPFHKSTSDRVATGVAGGIAHALRIPAIYVRAAFVCLSLAGGVGAVLYLLLALLAPTAEVADEPSATIPVRRMVGLAMMFIAAMILLQGIGLWLGGFVWPAILVIFGLAIAIETSGVNYERSLAGIAGADGGKRSWWLVVGGIVMMVTGIVVSLSSLDSLQGVGVLAVAVVAALGGFFIVAGPWLWSLIEELQTERRERIRSEEKAEMAAHLHDSVLQTLALIQRTDDPKKMVTLARSQERELRSWLFDEAAGDADTLVGALSASATKVEEAHDVPVSVVVVGESTLTRDRQNALVAAATEAMLNAAKHSGAVKVSVFAEAVDGTVDIFVTDQGIGFEPDRVGDDRKGIEESIEGRMKRHGGTATIDSEIGVGTEVHLTMSGGLA